MMCCVVRVGWSRRVSAVGFVVAWVGSRMASLGVGVGDSCQDIFS